MGVQIQPGGQAAFDAQTRVEVDPSTPAFAQVALPLPIEHPFTYSIPDELRGRVRVGMRVLVGVKNRVETGYITGLSHESDIDVARPIADLPDDTPVFTPGLIKLCAWVADYYCCGHGEALQCAVPPGIVMRQKRRFRLCLEKVNDGRFTDIQRAIVAELHRRGPLTGGQLSKAVGRTGVNAIVRGLVKRGLLIEETEAAESSVSVSTEVYVRLVEEAVPDAAALEALQRRAPRQAAVYLDLLHGEPERLASALYEKHQVDSAILRSLEAKGLIQREEREAYRMPDLASHPGGAIKHDLNADQRTAYDAIVAAMEAQTFQSFLLKGITGSGKTEVYLQAIERALELGRDAIMLVPEISLTPQTVGRFKARFQERIAVLHSGLGAGERYDEWRRAQRGEVRIVVGARSAIFAPLANVGIIVVDEEHDSSYKQSETPRYHARDVAVMRANMAGAVCVLGSATPSIEAYHNSRAGKSQCIELRTRATLAKLPQVELVDMRIETREVGGNVILSRRLEAAINERVENREQVLLLLNRRGFSPFVLCPACGWSAECPDCNVSLTYHAKGGHMSCHYCNGRQPLPPICKQCGFAPLLHLGTGTQRAEDYLLRSFPGARIERMDADTTAGKGGHAKILGRLAQGDIDILIGTQMIAKGHDYPAVTLVGVINADTGLILPDFRAAESAFQLLTQVAGRAGRGDRPGEVIIQTYRPNHYAVQAAAEHDYETFFEKESAHRQSSGYPPFRRMANLMVESEDAALAERAASAMNRLARENRELLDMEYIAVLGPAPATVRRVKKKYRWNLALLAPRAQPLNRLCRAVREGFAELPYTNKVQLKIDLDPYGVY